MFEPFYPDYYVSSAYAIDYRKLYDSGVRGVIFDVDNTLVPHDAPADNRAKRLFQEFHTMGMETCLLSNNREPRVAGFAAEVGTKYIYKGNKPLWGQARTPPSLWGISCSRTSGELTGPALSAT